MPWYLRIRTVGCWLWILVWSVLAGVFVNPMFWLVTIMLFVVALAVLARDPNDP